MKRWCETTGINPVFPCDTMCFIAHFMKLLRNFSLLYIFLFLRSWELKKNEFAFAAKHIYSICGISLPLKTFPVEKKNCRTTFAESDLVRLTFPWPLFK